MAKIAGRVFLSSMSGSCDGDIIRAMPLPKTSADAKLNSDATDPRAPKNINGFLLPHDDWQRSLKMPKQGCNMRPQMGPTDHTSDRTGPSISRLDKYA